MDTFLSELLQASFFGSIIILLVLILRLVLKKIPKTIICLLWLLAFARLLIPFSPESRLSLQPDFSISSEEIQSAVDSLAEIAVPEGDPVFTTVPVDAITASPSEVYEPELQITWHQIALPVWLLGCAVLLISALVSYLRLKRLVREAVRREERVWEVCGLDTAFVLGLFRPKIYIPAGMDTRNRHFVIAHERAHIARRDHWYKPVGYLILIIHWFNPLVWLAYVLLCRDIEMACDEQVVRSMDTEQRKAYSSALLSCSTRHRGITACPVAFGEVSVKQRIIGVLNYRKPGFWIILVAVVAVIFVSVCFMTAPVAEDLPDGIVSITPPENAEELEQWVQDALVEISSKDHYHFSSESEFKVNEFLTTEIYMTDKNWTHIQTRQGIREIRTYRNGIGESCQDTVGWTPLDQVQDVPSHWLLTTPWDTAEISVLQYRELNSGHEIECLVNHPMTVGEETAPDFWLRVELTEQKQLRFLTMRACVDEERNGRPVSRQLQEENLNMLTSTSAEIMALQKIDQCQMALAKWRSYDSYHLSVDQQFERDLLNSGATQLDYWKTGNDWLKLRAEKLQEFTLKHWSAQKDGMQFSRTIITPSYGSVSNSGWTEDDFDPELKFVPWLLVDWAEYTMTYVDHQSAMGEEMVALRLNPVHSDNELPRQVWFYFDKDGELAYIVQTHSTIGKVTIDGETSQSTTKYTDTIRLLSTDADEIRNTMEEQLTR